MAIRDSKLGRLFVAGIWVTICISLMPKVILAKIPEPDNIIYGIPTPEATTVTLKVNGQAIAFYDMGTNPDAGPYYVLNVPIDALDPQSPGTARPGDTAGIYVNNESTPATTAIIGQRGSVQLLHLAPDSDGDGVTDAEELSLGLNPHNRDTDGDGLDDFVELSKGMNPKLFDTDGDGFSDGYEALADTDPLDEDDIPVIYVDAGNTSGTEDGSVENPFNTIGEAISAAPEAFTVSVAAGLYEEAVIINKNIRLIGDSPTHTIIDAGGSADAVYYSYTAQEISSVEKFRIQNAGIGINCGNGASPLIRNNIITQIDSHGIVCGEHSTAKIINNTIANNLYAAAVQSASSDIVITNNIISGNYEGIKADVTIPGIDYNNVWNNPGGNYVGCIPGAHDRSENPQFVDSGNDDFHLGGTSPSLDAGDPVEILTADYTGGGTLMVDEVTHLDIGDRIWITDGVNLETDAIAGVTPNTIGILGQFMADYLVSDMAYIFAETSDARNEPSPGNERIDMGAYGNTDEAGSHAVSLGGDVDFDGDADGSDLAKFVADFGRTDCGGGCEGDLNGDNNVDEADLLKFIKDFGGSVFY